MAGKYKTHRTGISIKKQNRYNKRKKKKKEEACLLLTKAVEYLHENSIIKARECNVACLGASVNIWTWFSCMWKIAIK